MKKTVSRCLLCVVKVEPGTTSVTVDNFNEEESFLQFDTEEVLQVADNSKNVRLSETTTTILQRQLDVIFLLRNVLQLSPSQLGRFLKVRGNPEDWISLCGSCSELVTNAKKIFKQLQKISNKYDEAKTRIEERIRATSILQEVQIEDDFILQESRKIVCKRKRSFEAEQVFFLQGDRKAQQLLQNSKQGLKERIDEDETKREGKQMTRSFKFQNNSNKDEIENPPMYIDEGDPSSNSEALDENHSVRSCVNSSSSSSDTDAEDDGDDDDNGDYLCDNDDDSESEDETNNQDKTGSVNSLRGKRKQSSLQSKFEAEELTPDSLKRRKLSGTSHVKNPSPGNKNECSLCRPTGKNYIKANFTKLLAHIYRYHQKPYKCTNCEHRFRSLKTSPIVTHYRRMHKELRSSIPMDSRVEEVLTSELPDIYWSCPTCPQEFLEEYLRDMHIETEHGNDDKLGRGHKCDHCPNKYFSEDEVNAHILLSHPIFFKKTQYQCDICHVSLKNEKILRLHRIQKHDLDLYKCPHCEAQLKNERKLNDHIILKHGDLEGKEKLEKIWCKLCRKTFANEEYYSIHMKSYHDTEDESQFTCHVCQKAFKVKHTLKLHLFTKHGVRKGRPVRTFPCAVEGCGKIMLMKKAYEEHLKWHQEVPTCEICKKEFKLQITLERHEFRFHKIVKPSTQNMTYFECKKCELRFFNEKHLKIHFLKCQRNKGGPSECDICKTKCASSKDLRIHEKFKHSITSLKEESEEEDEQVEPEPDLDLSLPCPYCGKFSLGEHRLELHIRRVHLEKDKEPRYACNICPDKKFDVRAYLDKHLAKEHDIGTEDYKCFLCGKFLPSKAQKKRHICGVKDEAKLLCKICGKEFLQRYYLDKHIAHVHEKRLEVCCDLCEYRSSKETDLQKHKAAKHQIGIKCQVEGCPRFFAFQKDLEKHVKIKHSEGERERPFLCTECGQGFYNSCALARHQEALHLNKDSRPYKCEICDKGFASPAYRSMHMKTHAKYVEGLNN